MKDILLNATLTEKISNKSGKPYYVIEVELTPTLKKQVFLEQAEVEVVKLYTSMTYDKK